MTLYTNGLCIRIKFGCDWWGICRNDILELTSHINPDAEMDLDRLEKSLKIYTIQD